MVNKIIRLNRRHLGRIRGELAVLGLSFLLVIGILVIVPAAVAARGFTPDPSTLPRTAVLTTTVSLPITTTWMYTSSLAVLGYADATLDSPYDIAEYTIRLPEIWQVEPDSVLRLRLDYFFQAFSRQSSPEFYGQLKVFLEDDLLDVISIQQDTVNSQWVSVPLPARLFAVAGKTRYRLKLVFDASHLCQQPHRAKLTVFADSYLELNYTKRPLTLDLALYPRPFYQGAFMPDIVQFVLPESNPQLQLDNAATVAAKLGDLTSNRLVISATTDVALLSGSLRSEAHLVAIGTPQENKLINFLNRTTTLPVSLYQRQLSLSATGPTTVSVGDVVDYRLSITNTTAQPLNLSLAGRFSANWQPQACVPECNLADGQARWDDFTLLTGASVDLDLSLQAVLAATGTLESVFTLYDATQTPINANTLTASIGLLTDKAAIASTDAGPSFFVYNGQAVAATDGIVQEVVSPWNEHRAILLLTGLTGDAVRKASLAIASESRFPGMSGSVALIKEVSLSGDRRILPTIEETLADLGYTDEVLWGLGAAQEVSYFFKIPYNWQLTQDAFIELHFSHIEPVGYNVANLTVLLNGTPVAGTVLSEQTAQNGVLRLALVDAPVRTGVVNRLTVRAMMQLPGICANMERTNSWLLVKAGSSRLVLAHQQEDTVAHKFDFNRYPGPFTADASLQDTLVILAEQATPVDWANALQVIARLGTGASGQTMMPAIASAADVSEGSLVAHNLVVIGRTATNGLLRQINTRLPLTAVSNDNQLQHILMGDVVFRLPDDYELSYLQMAPSLWNENYAMLLIGGTTDKSINQAINILTRRTWALKGGDLALVKPDDTVIMLDTSEFIYADAVKIVANAIPEATVETISLTQTTTTTITVAVIPTASSTPVVSVVVTTPSRRPAWLIPFVGVMAIIVLAILALAFWRARANKL